jgi:hypothetical protein
MYDKLLFKLNHWGDLYEKKYTFGIFCNWYSINPLDRHQVLKIILQIGIGSWDYRSYELSSNSTTQTEKISLQIYHAENDGNVQNDAQESWRKPNNKSERYVT